MAAWTRSGSGGAGGPGGAVAGAARGVGGGGRREAAAGERHERGKIRRDDRKMGHDHPVRLVAGLGERLDQVQPLGELLRLQFRSRLGDLHAEIGGEREEVDVLRLRLTDLDADAAGKLRAVLREQVGGFREVYARA